MDRICPERIGQDRIKQGLDVVRAGQNMKNTRESKQERQKKKNQERTK